MQLFAFTVDRETEPGSWERVASWERFGMDEAEALAGTLRAARDEFPADTLRVRPSLERVDVETYDAPYSVDAYRFTTDSAPAEGSGPIDTLAEARARATAYRADGFSEAVIYARDPEWTTTLGYPVSVAIEHR